jgi:leader peptidase (prepilin peptidase) / N-methyltransferase
MACACEDAADAIDATGDRPTTPTMESAALLSAALGFLFGAFIGSFLNVCIHRLPRNESVVLPPSRCYSCGTQVQWYDNLPVISYLILRGRCRWCDAPFSVRYLLLEVLVGVVSALVMWWAFAAPVAPAPWLLTLGAGEPLARALAGAAVLALAYLLVVASFIDLEHTIIPDELTKPFQVAAPVLALASGSVLGLSAVFDPTSWLVQRNILGDPVATTTTFIWRVGGIAAAVLLLLAVSLPLARIVYSRFCPPEQRWSEQDHRGFRVGVWWFMGATASSTLALLLLVAWQPGAGDWWRQCAGHGALALFGSLTGWLSLYLVGLVGTIAFRRNAMGFGDVKFLAPIGAFLGPVGVLYAFFFAAIVGTIVGLPMRLLASRREIPFGPWLAVGALLALVWGPALHGWLFSQIRLG